MFGPGHRAKRAALIYIQQGFTSRGDSTDLLTGQNLLKCPFSPPTFTVFANHLWITAWHRL